MNFVFFKKKFLLLLVIPPLFLFAYWFKYQMGINFFHSISVSHYPPFKYLINNVITPSHPGIIFKEDFNNLHLFRTWTDAWMQEKGAVEMEFTSGGLNDSGCILITNTGQGTWAISHRKRVKVKKGDRFYFKGSANIKGNTASAYLSVAAFTKRGKVIGWNLFKQKINQTGTWTTVQEEFTIPDDGTRYIIPRLVGAGKGIYRFDDIIFEKMN